MEISALVIALSAVVVIAATVLIADNEPPLWASLLACLAAWSPASTLLGIHVPASAVGDSTPAQWGVRIAMASAATAVLSFFLGNGLGKGRRADHADTMADRS
ncbi:hypothetical protein ACWGDT_28575 [Streptomyces avermitilis]